MLFLLPVDRRAGGAVEEIVDADAVIVDQPVDYDGDGEITDEDAIWLLMYTFFPDDYPIA